MHTSVRHTDSFKARVVNRPPNDPFVVLECMTGDVPSLIMTLTRAEVQDLIAKMIECDENWPTEPPAEEPTAEDDHGINGPAHPGLAPRKEGQ